MQRNVLEYLEATADRLPEKIAFSGGESGLTFGQVQRAAQGVGTFLAQKGVRREPVAVFMERCPEAVAAFFGAVYGGGFYVPIDSEMPRYRIEQILHTLRPRAVLCSEKTRHSAGEAAGQAGGAAYLYTEAAATEPDMPLLREIRRAQIDTDPLYVVFTSGSTGVPKGVIASHRSVIDYVEQLSEILGFSESTVFGSQTPLYFDACLKELYPTIKFGATTYLIPKSLFMFPVRLIAWLNQYKINTICWVASALALVSGLGAFREDVPRCLHTVAFGSEVFPARQLALWRQALPEARFTNLYGPTEATGMSCYYHIEREFAPDEPIPIGQPFPNTGLLLLTEDGREAAPGETGEIALRGTCLALGYYQMAEQTAENFVQNPLQSAWPERVYRTGDLGRYNERGELVFVSRRDHQIKHMGHRVELQEIEATAALHPGVAAACAVYQPEKDHILFYYTGDAQEKEAAAFLRERLPRYMVPNRIQRLAQMPRTPNGKTDRRALTAFQEEGGQQEHG